MTSCQIIPLQIYGFPDTCWQQILRLLVERVQLHEEGLDILWKEDGWQPFRRELEQCDLAGAAGGVWVRLGVADAHEDSGAIHISQLAEPNYWEQFLAFLPFIR